MNIRPARLFFFCLLIAVSCCSEAFSATLAPDFGIDGRVAVELGRYGSRGNAVVVQPDGKIVVAGSSSSTADKDFMLFRLLQNGSLDHEFNSDGTATTAVGAFDDEALALALQTDGKIVAVGYSSNEKNRDLALVRYNSDGSIDRTFGVEGMSVTAVGSSHDEITDVAVQPDGSIVIVGSAQGANGRVVVLGRYRADGKPDRTFADEGFALSVVGLDAQAESLALTESGRILVSGTYSDADRRGLMLLGFTADGRMDSSFGENGVGIPADSSTFSEGYGMFVDKDGKVLVAGSVGKDGTRDAALFKFTAEGRPDSAFEKDGVFATAASAQDDILHDVAIAGKTIAATGFKTVGEQREFLLITYEQVQNGEGQPAHLLATMVTTAFADGEDVAAAVAAVSESSLVVAGASGTEETSSAAVSKYTTLETASADGSSSTGSATVGSQLVLTGEPYEVTRTTAIVPGEVLSGLSSVSQRGVVFSVMANPVLKADSSEDGTAPKMSNLSPSNGTVSGSSVTLSLATDVDATCKYDDSAGVAYDQMSSSFDTTGGKNHSELVTGLEAGKTYNYYVRCKNTATGAFNATDGKISFNVGDSDDEGPTRTNLSPSNGTVSGSSVTLSLTTDVDATCKYDDSAGVAYDQMSNSFDTTGEKNHSELVTGLEAGKTYNYYVRCKNTATGAVNATDKTISFAVQSANDTGPARSNLSPSNGTVSGDSATLSLTTDVDATCKYEDSAGVAYDQMSNSFDTTGGKNHSAALSGLSEGTHAYYVRCKNTATGAVNVTDATIEFETANADVTPPEITNKTDDQVNASSVVIHVATDEGSACRCNKSSDINYDAMMLNLSGDGEIEHYSANLEKPSSSSRYTYYVRCKDDAGNESNPGQEVSFLVTPVVIKNNTDSTFAPKIVALSVATDVNAFCSYDAEDKEYDGMSKAFSVTGGKTHADNVELPDEGVYSYYVRCKNAASGESSPASTKISFSVVAVANSSSPARRILATSEKIVASTLQTAGGLLVGTAIAADDDASPDTDDANDSNNDADDDSDSSSDFLEEGHTSESGGTGAFSSRLENLKPGTFFYARAYAVSNGTTYYGNQVGFMTADSCFVATAAFGSIFHPSVQILRDFRDQIMADSRLGRAMTALYYDYSPPAAEIVSKSSALRFAARLLLLPVVGSAWLVMHDAGRLLFLLLAAAVGLLLLSWHGRRQLNRRSKEA